MCTSLGLTFMGRQQAPSVMQGAGKPAASQPAPVAPAQPATPAQPAEPVTDRTPKQMITHVPKWWNLVDTPFEGVVGYTRAGSNPAFGTILVI